MLQIGTVLSDRYELLEKIGSGGLALKDGIDDGLSR